MYMCCRARPAARAGGSPVRPRSCRSAPTVDVHRQKHYKLQQEQEQHPATTSLAQLDLSRAHDRGSTHELAMGGVLDESGARASYAAGGDDGGGDFDARLSQATPASPALAALAANDSSNTLQGLLPAPGDGDATSDAGDVAGAGTSTSTGTVLVLYWYRR